MIIGAAVAGLLIVSLFFEMLSSSPKSNDEGQVKVESMTPRVK